MRKWLIVVPHGLDAGKAISHIEVVRGENADWEVLHKKQKITHNRHDQVCSAHKDRSTVLINTQQKNISTLVDFCEFHHDSMRYAVTLLHIESYT